MIFKDLQWVSVVIFRVSESAVKMCNSFTRITLLRHNCLSCCTALVLTPCVLQSM